MIAFWFTFFLALGILSVWKMIPTIEEAEKQSTVNQILISSPTKNKKENFKEPGSGFSGACFGKDDSRNEKLLSNNKSDKNNRRLNVLYKPRALYTEEAKLNNIQGKVRVRVTFLANGEIGSVSEVAGLPFGLTEKAIDAAKKMRFEPQISNGRLVAVTKVVVFNFTIY